MSLTTKALEHVVPAYNLPRGGAVGRGKVAEAAQAAGAAEVARAAQAPEGRMVSRELGRGCQPDSARGAEEGCRFAAIRSRSGHNHCPLTVCQYWSPLAAPENGAAFLLN